MDRVRMEELLIIAEEHIRKARDRVRHQEERVRELRFLYGTDGRSRYDQRACRFDNAGGLRIKCR